MCVSVCLLKHDDDSTQTVMVSTCGVWLLCFSVSSSFSEMGQTGLISRQEMSQVLAAVRMMFRGNDHG